MTFSKRQESLFTEYRGYVIVSKEDGFQILWRNDVIDTKSTMALAKSEIDDWKNPR